MPRGETLELLHSAHESLMKAGRNSLEKAYAFGNVVNALHGLFSYAQMAQELAVTPSTVSKYAKLYRKYSTVQLLLHAAAELHTYDVGRLVAEDDSTHYVYFFHCRNCGSDDVGRERRIAGKAEAVAELTGYEKRELGIDA